MNFNLNDYKNLIILFPPGLGGNHLKNILTLHSKFEGSEYFSEIKDYYNNITIQTSTAHFSQLNLQNLQRVDLQKNIDMFLNSSKINIMCGHISEYIWVEELMCTLPNKLFLIIDWSDIDELSLEYKRLLAYNSSISMKYHFYEQQTLYRMDVATRLLNSFEGDHSTIKSNLLFSKSIDKLLKFLSHEFNLQYTSEQKSIIEEIHMIWFNKLNEVKNK